jgi:hypothetical protein
MHQLDENKDPNKSTGPRTPEGKAVSSRNSMKHGLASGQLMIPGEDPAAFEAMLSEYENDFQAANSVEADLVYDLAKYRWLTDRALRLQAAALSGGDALIPTQLPLLIRYHTTHHRAFHTTLKALQAAQKERKKAEQEFVSQQPKIKEEEPLPVLVFGSYNDPIDYNADHYDPEEGWISPERMALKIQKRNSN